MKLKEMFFLCLTIIFLFACENPASVNVESGTESNKTTEVTTLTWDLDQIVESGELIAVTLNGPETYYEYQGVLCGIQYKLAENFSQAEGTRLRIEVVRDTASLFEALHKGDADLIACELSENDILRENLAAAGVNSSDSLGKKKSWVVRKESVRLCSALNNWYSARLKQKLSAKSQRLRTYQKHRKVNAPYISKEKGIISSYDAYFIRYSRNIDWDWKLLAAQCYQESAFDPEAVSWTGARGLMQIMPQTAQKLGLSNDNIHNPEANIQAATMYIKQLGERFKDVSNRYDRICFILAAYNGGYHHIRDAMSLAKKYGHNSLRWNEVSPFVLGLSQSRYYNDPVVKYGYMIGTETHAYVYAIINRWNQYKGGSKFGASHSVPMQSSRRNRFTREVQIFQPEELKEQQDTLSDKK